MNNMKRVHTTQNTTNKTRVANMSHAPHFCLNKPRSGWVSHSPQAGPPRKISFLSSGDEGRAGGAAQRMHAI